jgi:uncharacterized membrane protein YidH (DUF202 family)
MFSFSEAHNWSQIYGILLMPVAIGFSIYSLFIYMKRAGMIRRKDPGPCKNISFQFRSLYVLSDFLFLLVCFFR